MEENAEFKKRKIEEHYALLNRLAEESRMKRTMRETEHAKKMEIYEMYQSELKVICLIPFFFVFFGWKQNIYISFHILHAFNSFYHNAKGKY